MNAMAPPAELFDRIISYPDPDQQGRFARLVGLDEHKSRLTKILGLLVNPAGLSKWAQKHHPGADALLDTVLRRPPLVVLAGDVGSGKTELAETIGDAVARQEDIDINLFPLSLSSRGQGRVGEMTQLISSAFEHTMAEAQKLKSTSGRNRGAVILLVDEADSLAQSREAAQMHHEDRAGVNAFIRGIDSLASARVPAAVIMCTNRRFVLGLRLHPLGLSQSDLDALVGATGRQKGRDYGFTFSDITQRLLPAIVLDAYPSRPVRGARAVEIAHGILPTPPFQEEAS